MHALYLLSNFMYFGNTLLREMLRVLYRDLFKYRIVETIRRRHADTTDLQIIERDYAAELQSTYFLGIGNPSGKWLPPTILLPAGERTK